MDRGTKRRCPHCGAPFYDLNRHPILCPRCGEEVRPEASAKLPPRGGGRGRPSAPVIEAPEDAGSLAEDEEKEVLEERDDEDDEELGGDVASDDDQDDLRE